jgi:CheY-like chemotaxis protein
MNQQTVPKILVVEDEPLVRVNAAEMIEEAGWRALEAENSAEALRVLADHRDVAVLFTDINMPGDMDGLALADCVHKLHPQIELVVHPARRSLRMRRCPMREPSCASLTAMKS